MVAGGIAIQASRVDEVNEAILEIKERVGIKSKFHWSEYRGGARQAGYEDLVRLYYSLIDECKIHSHLLICDFKAFDHKRGGVGSPERSANKMYYQLLLHRLCKFYGRDCDLYAFPDRGDDSKEVISFRGAICASAYTKFKARPNSLKAIQPQNSERQPIIQMVDVIIGAIAAKREDRTLKPHKASLADYVLHNSPVSDWSKNTSANAKKFNVWNFK